jgi:PAS domain S-box-containing protein
VFGEDMAVTLDRGHGPEVAYFTFSYSAVHDETGAVAGMFATALETTRRLKAEQSQRESARRFRRKVRAAGLSSDFRALFEAVPTPFIVLAPPDFTIVAVNDAYLLTSMTRRAEIVGRSVFDVFPDDPSEADPMGERKLRASLQQVMSSRRSDVMGVLRYPIRLPPEQGGGFVQRWWTSMNTPVLGPDGAVALILHRTEDVTEIVTLRSQSAAHDQLLRDQQTLIDRLRSTEGTLRRTHERQDFLLRLSDTMRPIDHPTEVQAAVCGLLAEHLRADRVFFVEVNAGEGVGFIGPDYRREGLASLSGQYALSEIIGTAAGSSTHRAQALFDVSSAPSLRKSMRAKLAAVGIRSLASTAVVRYGQLQLTLNAASKVPRSWSVDELTLLQAVSERAWDAIERSRAELALRDSEERLRRAMRIATVGVMFFDLQGRITEVNETFERMTGYTRAELRALPDWRALTPPEFRNVTERAADELASGRQPAPYEKQIAGKNGTRRWGLSAPTRLSTGAHAACIEFIIDITEAKEAEEALQLADRRKDEFLATLAHELRNPLAPLRNGLQIIRRAHASGQSVPVERVVAMMDRQLSHLVHLVDDLLDVGRITCGKIQLKIRDVLLDDVLANSVEACRGMIDEHGHELIMEGEVGGLHVRGDFDRLTQVFSNLLSNAVKYTERGGRIHIRTRVAGGMAVVEVRDTGIGIPQSDLQHVFDLFSQVRVHQGRTEGGLGIGLSLVRQILNLHGGTADVSSEGAGRGSTFTVRLPLALRPVPQEPQSRRGDTQLSPAHRRVLVVDDNADAASSLAMLLQQLGHLTAVAHDGDEALEVFQTFHPDTVFMDIGMPRMNGCEAARRLRELKGGNSVHLVAVTGWGQDKDIQRTREAGFNLHLLKPVGIDALNGVLAEPSSSVRH